MAKQLPSRSEIPTELTWNLASIYAEDRDWMVEYAAVEAELPALRARQGMLGRSGHDLFQALAHRDRTGVLLDRLSEYATHRHHEDLARPEYTGMADRVIALAAAFRAAISFYTPEVVAIQPERLDRFFAETPELAAYRHEIDVLGARRAHVRSAEVEHVLAGVAELAESPQQVYEAVHTLDQRLPTIAGEDGDEVQLTHGLYRRFMHSADREVRRTTFDGMLGAFKARQYTIAATLSAQVKKDIFYARARGYSSTLEAALDETQIPTQVYHTLVDTVHAALPLLHRYLDVRRRVLSPEEPLHMYDLSAPLVQDADPPVEYADACRQVVAALAPLGPEYTATVELGLRSRWIDVLENRGKRSGAYSAGSYTTDPFILLNFHARRDDVFTLAHELGHSLHTRMANGAQPYHYAQYSIFLAEIASTFNEALLRHYLLQHTDSPAARAAIVSQYLEDVRSTVFRQTLFAEFELKAHALVETGGSITAEALAAIYRERIEHYYGAGGVIVDDLIAWEWGLIPHFYSSYYVYQYATGFAASAVLAANVLREGQPAVDRYLGMLRGGSSRYPIDLLRDAGVDMTTAAPIETLMQEFSRAIETLSTLV